MIGNRELRQVYETVFPDGNYYMYWLYYSFLLVFPILLYCFVIVIGFLDYGVTIRTDTFVATQLFKTSNTVPDWVLEMIGVMLTYVQWLWIGLFIHTLASTVSDGYMIRERRNDL